MANLSLSLYHDNTIVAAASDDQSLYLATQYEYAPGDYYQLRLASVPAYVQVQLDAALSPAVLYITKSPWRFTIPVNDQGEWGYPDSAFAGSGHYVTAKLVDESAIGKNVAVNSHDQHADTGAYPHASANAETRGEYVFYARNAIDGIVANHVHGRYPYQSWGIDSRDDAEFTLDFGRLVNIDGIGLLLRADYPHDSHWTAMTVAFSDGSKLQLAPQKTADMQHFAFPAKTVTSLKLTHLVKDVDASSFPALTELEVYAKEA